VKAKALGTGKRKKPEARAGMWANAVNRTRKGDHCKAALFEFSRLDALFSL